ncbi:MAG: HAMP domain-containing protein [Chloroflexi bacterium]|nr:HAMP domain-containing protein [Chloroflexota bacterium]
MNFSFLHSIRFRLLMWFAVILTAVMLAFSAFIYFSQARDIRGDALSRLTRKADTIADDIQLGKIPKATLQENDIFLLFDSKGKLLYDQGTSNEHELEELLSKAREVVEDDDHDHINHDNSWVKDLDDEKHYMFIAANTTEETMMILGSPFDPYDLNGRLLFTLFLGSGFTLAVALGGGWWLADRAMRPVKTITQTARAIGETDLSRRLNLKTKDELGELANTFDAMLARLQAAFNRQRQFIADASHELRTPLTIVNLETSRALASKRTSQEYQRAMNVIQSENAFMTHLVNDLLILARIDSGQSAIQKEPLDLSDIALDAVERLSALAEKNNVTLETGELPEVTLNGDRQLLLQMVSNLIENGIKYTVGNERRVKVETGAGVDSVWVRVSDNGAGIPSEHLPRLFDRFYQADKARTHDAEDVSSGSGLGLSIVQSIAHIHGGEVHVQSAPGEGTTFEVKFRMD